MKRSTLFRHIRKGVFLFFALALIAGYSVHDVLSHYTGGAEIAEYPKLAQGCGQGLQCHGLNPDTSTHLHLFVPAKIYAGSTDTLRLSVSNSNKEDIEAGFDIDVDTPAMFQAIPGTNTVVTVDTFFYFIWSIGHNKPQLFSANGPKSDSAVWTFLYTPRSTAGMDTLYVAGNAVNGDSAYANDSDRWFDDTVFIKVLPALNSVAPSSPASSVQIYPNPASNEIFVNDGIPADAGTYTLTDPAGRVVLSGHPIPLDGNHSIDLSSVNAGAYILNVQPRNGQSFSRKIVVQR